MGLINLISLNSKGDERGHLVAIEARNEIPFDIKRVYYIFGTESLSRGFHAHKELVQLAVCVKGSCTMLLDDGFSRESVILDSPFYGILIPKMAWREMHNFSQDCVLLVLASEYYCEADYIRDYQEFLIEVENAKK